MHRNAIIMNNQREVVEFLSRPSSYASSPDRVETFETHGAFVFLAGEEAYKIKKAVRFAYMDYSTLEKRHHFCERETSVNQAIARDLYLGTIPITRERDGGLAIDGAGIHAADEKGAFEHGRDRAANGRISLNPDAAPPMHGIPREPRVKRAWNIAFRHRRFARTNPKRESRFKFWSQSECLISQTS